MLRMRYEVPGGPEVLFAEDVPVPVPGPGELLVRTEAVGVTLPVVRKVREGGEAIPLGGEVAGTVAALGEGVAGFAVGERVTGLCFGHGYAEYALLGAPFASHVPEGAGSVDAVALVRSGLVARGACAAGGIRPGESVLVTAAASGVGSLALKLARAEGAGRVVAAVSSADKADFVRGLGADEVVLYGDTGGRLVAYGSGGGTVEAYELLVRGASVIGFQIRAVAQGRPEEYEAWRRGLWEAYGSGALRPAVHGEIPLAEAARAHALIEERRNLGKVVLTV